MTTFVHNSHLIVQVKNTHELRGTALKTCISHYQDKVMTAKNENNRSAQRQAQMHVGFFIDLQAFIITKLYVSS